MYVSHVRLLVMNFADCFRFYRDVMGFKVSWGDENDTYASFTREDSGEPMLALFDRKLMAEEIGSTQLTGEAESKDKSILIVEVENVDRIFEELSTKGVSFIVKPKDYPGWGIRSAYLRDPAGNLIELSAAFDPSRWTEELPGGGGEYSVRSHAPLIQGKITLRMVEVRFVGSVLEL